MLFAHCLYKGIGFKAWLGSRLDRQPSRLSAALLFLIGGASRARARVG